MTKKIFAIILAITLMLTTSLVFATNELQDSMNKSGNTLKNVVDGAGTVIRDAGDTITKGVEDVGDAIGNGARDIGQSVNDGARGLTKDMTRNDNLANNNGYRATRTSNDATIMGMTANTWTWLILGIAALAIVALVWYYAMQNKNEYTNND
ncbi:MAG: hypothetical protein HFJ27_00425 [Clostridia bacterium]|nr:hypothetical protein [Clostridia bacterium]